MAELHALAAASWHLVSTASDPSGFRRAAAARLVPMQRNWCAVHASLALALLASTDRAAAEAELLSLFRKPYDENRLAQPGKDAQLATAALVEIGRHGLLSQYTLETAVELARVDDLDMSVVAPASTLVREAAPYQRLPASLVSKLLEKMKASPGKFDFSPLAAFAVLASNTPYLQPNERAQISEWMAERAPQERTMSDFHRGLGYFAAATGKLDAWQRDILEARLSPLSRFPPKALTYRGETIITATDDEALVALGRVAQVTDIPAGTAERLANAAIGRPLLKDRRKLLKGLGEQWYRGIGAAALARAVTDRLSHARMDGARRNLEAEAAAERIAKLPDPKVQQVVKQLASRWRAEPEPEIRVALASVIALAIGARNH